MIHFDKNNTYSKKRHLFDLITVFICISKHFNYKNSKVIKKRVKSIFEMSPKSYEIFLDKSNTHIKKN